MFLCAAFIIGACNSKPSADESAAAKTFTSKNTDSFNIAFDSVLMNYDNLRNAFINWDTAAADKYAALLQTALIFGPPRSARARHVAGDLCHDTFRAAVKPPRTCLGLNRLRKSRQQKEAHQ